ncbi:MULTISPECIES: 4-hydroxythreonine-4-phosphate dehydrogenase PdxA [Rhodomicrobium]|uniref:4-hydroxythreonine-4-phosphate dehydrogenase PdxA n=1 Tax=Rhodomicrobium TaxID=1068 RepID=UPI000B4AC5D8|nr:MULTISPECIES: 4-hydroxythreonine-4-phosphate dehydrogenase PdxA [Rhodomicrobium]
MSRPSAAPRPLALTCGDPAGIGPDITLAAWLRREADAIAPFALLGDLPLLRARAAALGLDVPCVAIERIGEAVSVFPKALPVLPVPLLAPAAHGVPEPANVPAIRTSIERAVEFTIAGEALGVVTNPIAKYVMEGGGFAFPGHTEFLGVLAAEHGATAFPVMMLCGAGLRVVPVTIHIALASVPQALTCDLIAETARVTAAGLTRWFGIAKPRLAMTGLNPHAGESGLMGDEESRVIAPALALLRREGIDVTGPHPADTLFHARARARYDAAIAMYHDQALIPLKTLAFDEGVNVTLGLPFIRTSPDHGTAFDIAGSGKARPDSLIAALRMAAAMAADDRDAPARRR